MGYLARAVYKIKKQSGTVESLVGTIMKCWDEINEDILHNLVSSMLRRCSNVIYAKLSAILY